jgi:hypothetical protein
VPQSAPFSSVALPATLALLAGSCCPVSLHHKKAKVVPVLDQALRHEDLLREWSVVFLTSALVGGEWSASRPGKEPPVAIG